MKDYSTNYHVLVAVVMTAGNFCKVRSKDKEF